MAEFIDREAVRNELYEADAIAMKGVEILNKFPAADVVEVVRCKDCKHYIRLSDISNAHICGSSYGMDLTKPDDFCSYGERKD